MYVYMLFYVFSFWFVLMGNDWFMMWMGLEINMISFIVIMYVRYSQSSMEACFKYFFVQSLGSAVFMSCFYMSKVFLGDIIMMMLSYKMGAAPLFYWFPSICMNLSWGLCFILMSFQKLIPLMLLMMFSGGVLWMIIFVSLVVGVMGSFNQKNLKLLMAYSSIHHLGWIYLCMVCKDMISVVYLVMYSFMLLSLFVILACKELNYLIDIDGYKVKWWFMFNMLSMAGIPPMLGFFLKWMAFWYIINMHILWIMFMLLMSVCMFYVYFRVVYDVCMCFGYSQLVTVLGSSERMSLFDLYGVMGVLGGVGLLLVMGV